MKKRTKISLRTKIYLTIVGLLGSQECFTPPIRFPFPLVPVFPAVPHFSTGVAASPDLLLVTQYCTEDIFRSTATGMPRCSRRFPGFGSCREKYMAVAPSQSAAAGFTPRDVFATEGALSSRSRQARHAVCDSPGCTASDHNGITFDHFGHIWL